MPKPIKKRTSKKLASEDQLEDKLSEMRETLRRRQKTIIAVVAPLVIAAVLVAAVLAYRSTKAKEARETEAQAYAVFHELNQKTPLPKQERYQKALDLFQQAYKTKPSPATLLYIAHCYQELERYDEALKTLNDLLAAYPQDKSLVPLAYQSIVRIQLQRNNTQEAVKILNTLYESGEMYRDVALIELGRLLEKEGKTDEAKAKYKELSEKFPSSPFVDEAKAKLGEKKEKEK